MAERTLKVLVCGSRDWSDDTMVQIVLDGFNKLASDLGERMVVIEGGAKGADSHARQWATDNDVALETVEADWDKHGRAAGPIRNQKMLEQHEPDYVVAFSKLPITRGTSDMVLKARRHKVPVYHVYEVEGT